MNASAKIQDCSKRKERGNKTWNFNQPEQTDFAHPLYNPCGRSSFFLGNRFIITRKKQLEFIVAIHLRQSLSLGHCRIRFCLSKSVSFSLPESAHWNAKEVETFYPYCRAHCLTLKKKRGSTRNVYKNLLSSSLPLCTTKECRIDWTNFSAFRETYTRMTRHIINPKLFQPALNT